MSVRIKNQGIYTAVEGFDDETIGSIPTNWTDISSSGGSASVIETYKNHIGIIKLSSGISANFGAIRHSFTSGDKLSGIIEFRVLNSGGIVGNSYILLEKDDGTDIIQVGTYTNQIAYYDGAWHNIVGYSDDTWYQLSVRFRCTGGDALTDPDDDLVEGKFRVYVNETKYGDYNLTNDTDIDRISLVNFAFVPASSTIGYFDAIGWDWDIGYDIGDNLLKPDTDITSNISELIIRHKIKGVPKARMKVYGLNTPITYDDILYVTGNLNSMRIHGEPFDGAYNYKDSLHFRSETIGSTPADISQGTWTTNHSANCNAYIIDKYRGHAYSLQLEDYNGGGQPDIKHTFTSTQEFGTIEFWFSVTDVTKLPALEIEDDSNNRAFHFKVDASKMQLRYSGSWNDLYTSVEGGKSYRIRVDLECGSSGYLGLAADTQNVYVYDSDGITLLASAIGVPFRTSITSIAAFQMSGGGASVNYLYFISAIGYSWDSDYTIGDNINYETLRSNQTIFEGRVKTKDNEYEQNLDLESLSIEMEENRPGTHAVPYEPDGYSPITFNYTIEVLSEIIEDKLENVSASVQSEIHRAELNFLNDINGNFPFGIVDVSAGTGTMEVLTASLGSHKNYIHITHAGVNHGKFNIYFEAQTSGVIEWIVRTTDVAAGMTEMFLYDSGGVVKIKLTIQGSKHKWYDGINLTVGSGASTNTWYQYRLSFDCVTDTFSTWVNGTPGAVDADFFAASADIGQFHGEANHDIGNPTFDVYFDAFGWSWANAYSAASDPTDLDTYINSQVLVDNFQPGTTVIDLALTGATSVDRQGDYITNLEQFIWALTPDHKVIVSNGTIASQMTLANIDVDQVFGVDIIERFNKVIIKGGKTGGDYIEGSAEDTDASTTYNKRVLVRYVSDIPASTTLGEMAASVLALQGNVPIVITVNYWTPDNIYYQPGETIVIPADTIPFNRNTTFVAAGDWIIMEVIYDYMRQKSTLVLASALIFTYSEYTMQEAASLINQ